jgi:hypothetical protein
VTSDQERTLEILSLEINGASIAIEPGESGEIIVAWGPSEMEGALIHSDGEMDSGFGGSTATPPTGLDLLVRRVNALRGWRA